MKIVAISREETNILFQLLGIKTYTFSETDSKQFEIQFNKLLDDKEIGIILLNEKYLLRNRDFLRPYKIRKFPLIIEIPDMPDAYEDEYFFDFIKTYSGVQFNIR